MMLISQTGGWSLFLLAAVIPGVHLQENSSSIQPDPTSELNTEVQINQSVVDLSPKGPHFHGHSSSAQPESEVPTEAQTYHTYGNIPSRVAQGDGGSFQPFPDYDYPTGDQIYQPVLQPSESIPPIGSYMLKTPDGIPCIKATMGVEFIITEKKKWYLSLDPSRVTTSGYCIKDTAVLCLTLPNNAASLQFTFKKLQPKNYFCVTELKAHVTPLPVCHRCANKTYAGVMANGELFTTATGQSYKCLSESLIQMSSQLKIKLVPLQVQAFKLDKGQFGKEEECWADYTKRVVPIIIGAVVVCIVLVALVTFLFIRDRRIQGYDTL
ncbi:lysosome-associated membrane glycoprotein 3 [Cheilinus undulatus]|uniref:lysosome-associated membrane glycoprotein 3 n=1 Tax=Cheilinus undulatus TaxID=241271 RepID=UPI001BD3068B|nr:lysosome-associated membrane glycoprotein 3 [Cheilinus undulatus]